MSKSWPFNMKISNGESFFIADQSGERAPAIYAVNKRAKRLSLRLDTKKRHFVVTAPNIQLLQQAHEFAQSRAAWALTHYKQLAEAKPLSPGGIIPFQGIPTRLVLDKAHGRLPSYAYHDGDHRIIASGPQELFSGQIIRFFKRKARERLEEACTRYAGTLNVSHGKISVRDTKTRWGSCSNKGGLSFCWRLIMAPPFVLDYVAAHECCHLKEMNHSPKFWALLHKIYGDPQKAKAWLKQYGQALHSYGS